LPISRLIGFRPRISRPCLRRSTATISTMSTGFSWSLPWVRLLSTRRAMPNLLNTIAEPTYCRRETVHCDPEVSAQLVRRSKELYRPAFFRARQGLGCPSPDPIFIVGMPRAGSTLIEQILSSHSLVEGTMELPDMGNIVIELVNDRPGQSFPEFVADIDGAELRALGEKYIGANASSPPARPPVFYGQSRDKPSRIGLIQCSCRTPRSSMRGVIRSVAAFRHSSRNFQAPRRRIPTI